MLLLLGRHLERARARVLHEQRPVERGRGDRAAVGRERARAHNPAVAVKRQLERARARVPNAHLFLFVLVGWECSS